MADEDRHIVARIVLYPLDLVVAFLVAIWAGPSVGGGWAFVIFVSVFIVGGIVIDNVFPNFRSASPVRKRPYHSAGFYAFIAPGLKKNRKRKKKD